MILLDTGTRIPSSEMHDNDCFLNKYFDLLINITDVNKRKEVKVFLYITSLNLITLIVLVCHLY